DLYDTHDYGLPQEVQEHLDDTRLHCICDPNPPDREWNEPWHGQPFFISEIGGIAWPPEAAKALTFSYGEVPQTVEAFMDRLTKLLQVIRSDKRVFGYCYTQLTDIYQEINGLYYFDRTPKFPAEILKKAQDGIAAFEE
ncbi:MAG: hypothetical protein J6S21_01785, partial [Victivallales bacterium]|nr:hypothetical protein [Victivallales bacterium]